MQFRTVDWIPEQSTRLVPGSVRMIDQTRLPNEVIYLNLHKPEEMWKAIKTLQVRGAPAIGVAAAMGVVAAVQSCAVKTGSALVTEVDRIADYLATSRPTAVNLFWALNRMKEIARTHAHLPPHDLLLRLAEEALTIRDEDIAMCRAIGDHGAGLLSDGQSILTHCNAGGLATSQFGTALAPVYVAREKGMRIHVFADETRPLLQGARLTAWELTQAGIDVTVICDNMAGQVMKEGKVQAVFVGADRIAANGDAANKIGTYGVAILAHYHHIPFYVLAPTSTFDLSMNTGDEIPIEERDSHEITRGFGKTTAPEGVKTYNPAFDVTPAELITGIICEHGIARPDYRENLARLATCSTAPANVRRR